MSSAKHGRFVENLDECIFDGVGRFGFPTIKKEVWTPIDFIGFNYATGTKKHSGVGVHFFLDDYQFERVWRYMPKYAEILSRFDAVMSPDFSLYRDYPVAIQIYNRYRSQYAGAYLQSAGLKVYPTASWSDQQSVDWCFDGMPENGVVCVSSIGTRKDEESRRLFLYGYDAMCERLSPETIIFYGEVPNDCKGNVVRIKSFSDKFKEVRLDGR